MNGDDDRGCCAWCGKTFATCDDGVNACCDKCQHHDPHRECAEREKAVKQEATRLRQDLERAIHRAAILERRIDAIRDALSNAGESP